ncbi:RNA processing protein [Boothiomyces sp. JEL0866]|nr:RNA processing protein [Boothiomyces sp. JEL0866]
MLPLSLLNAALASTVLVELKNGDSYNGHLITCDAWMNIILKEVIFTSKDGDKFQRIPEIYIRGNTIKYLRIPDKIVDNVRIEQERAAQQGGFQKRSNDRNQRGKGGRDSRGRGDRNNKKRD